MHMNAKAMVMRTLEDPSTGGAALVALREDYITDDEWREIWDVCKKDKQAWMELRYLLACFVMLAEGEAL